MLSTWASVELHDALLRFHDDVSRAEGLTDLVLVISQVWNQDESKTAFSAGLSQLDETVKMAKLKIDQMTVCVSPNFEKILSEGNCVLTLGLPGTLEVCVQKGNSKFPDKRGFLLANFI